MTKSEIEAAMWEGDTEALHKLARCGCCCPEHTSSNCPARQWGGCLGGEEDPDAERLSWQKHYQELHGMTEEQFYA